MGSSTKTAWPAQETPPEARSQQVGREQCACVSFGRLTFELTGKPQPLKAAVGFPVQRRVRPRPMRARQERPPLDEGRSNRSVEPPKRRAKQSLQCRTERLDAPDRRLPAGAPDLLAAAQKHRKQRRAP